MVEPPFAVRAGSRCPDLAELTLALAAEFRAVDRAGALGMLDGLAAGLCDERRSSPARQCAALSDALDAAPAPADDGPAGLMLDQVLDRGRGHPTMLAVVWCEVARRAGLPIAPVGGPGLLLVAHMEADPPLVLDPANPGPALHPCRVPIRLRRRCSHEVAFAVLDQLMDVYALAGDVRRATRASELRLALPVSGDALRWVRRETAALRARLAAAP